MKSSNNVLSYHRKVSGNENMYIAGERLSSPFAIQVLVEGQGNIEIADLQAAVIAAADANPGSRLTLTGSLFNKRWIDSGKNPPVLSVESDWDGYDFTSAPFLKRRFDLENGPTCEVLVLKNTQTDLSRIIFRAFHGVMDAKGVHLWVEDVFRALNNKATIGATLQLTDLALAKSLEFKEYRPNFGFDCSSVTGPAKGRDKSSLWRRFQIPGNHPGLISKLAVTLAAASRAENTNETVRFMIPVDLRPHLDGQENGTGNLSNPLFLAPKPQESWIDIYQQVLESLDAKREGMVGEYDHLLNFIPASLLRFVFKSAMSWQTRSSRFMATGVLSNVGKIDLQAFSTKSFSATAINFLPFDILISPLTLVATENNEHLDVSLSIPEYLGNDGRIDKLVGLIKNSLGGRDTELPTSRTYQQVVELYNDTSVSVSHSETIIDLVEQQIDRTPAGKAISIDSRNITYAELGKLVSQQIQRLQAAGVSKGDLVGVLLDRSEHMVVNVLAILKCGAAYVPIDPEYPEYRKAQILEKAGVSLVVTRSSQDVPNAYTGKSLNIDNDLSNCETDGLTAPACKVDACELAYVIYTSGSTGEPKGVEIEHQQLVHYIRWASKVYADNKPTSFPLFSSLAFDLTVTSLFTPLVTGGCIEVISETNPLKALHEILSKDGVDIVKLTPSHLRLALEIGETPTRLNKLILGGEDLPTALCDEAIAKFGSKLEIYNEYGPTEATVGCMIHRYDATTDTGASVPIGVPADNTQLYILNEEGTPIVGNDVGELFIAGAGLARGYRHRTDLTNERFISSPFNPEKRMYRTGDLARWGEELRLEYCGRIDNQVKVNGFRVELEEIQSAINMTDGVEKSAVLVNDSASGASEICAFYTIDKDQKPLIEPTALRQALLQKLPAYMVPNQFAQVEEIPLTINGKIDGSALLSEEKNLKLDAVSKGQSVADNVGVLWADLLDLPSPKIDPSASFYDLGGDSLAMAKLLRTIRLELLSQPQQESFAKNVVHLIANPTFGFLVDTLNVLEEA